MALGKKSNKCVFCQISKQKKDKKNYIFARSPHSFAVLNIYPYNNGHVMIVPNRHVKDLSKLSTEEKADLIGLLESVKSLLDKTLKPQGYNIGINLGKVAGAGFPGHIHIHVVPRWRGDANFMPVIGKTKVISQSLSLLYTILSRAQKKPSRSKGKR